jgi:integrase
MWHLSKFCRHAGKKPDALVRLRRNSAEKAVQKYADSLKTKSPRYSKVAILILKTFFRVNGFKREKELELETYHIPPRYRLTREYIPTKNEVYRMADLAGSARNRAIILVLYGSGLRNSTFRSLLYKDVAAELKSAQTNIMLRVYPEMKKVDPSACKGNIPYYTFICDEATQALKLYLKQREEEYGSLSDSDPLICSNHNQIGKAERTKKVLSQRQLQTLVKSIARRAGLADWKHVHPHCLRKSFETVLHSPLIDGSAMDVKVQEFFMGHILPGSQDYYFDSSKTERMRIIYSKLKFGRTPMENKFTVLRMAVARAFEDTEVDPEQIMEEYVKSKGKMQGM